MPITKKSITLLEVVISLIVMGVLLVSLGLSLRAFSSIENKSHLSDLLQTVQLVENIFQRHYRGLPESLNVIDDHTVSITVYYPGSPQGREIKYVFAHNSKGGELQYYPDAGQSRHITVLQNPYLKEMKFTELIAHGALRSHTTIDNSGHAAYMRNHSAVEQFGSPRLGIYIEIAKPNQAPERIYTSIIGRVGAQSNTAVTGGAASGGGNGAPVEDTGATGVLAGTTAQLDQVVQQEKSEAEHRAAID